jgi:endogenous inhibitor of DNA gyrase (YacG/DUF329 family)
VRAADKEAIMSEPSESGAGGPGTPPRRCPICRKPTVDRYRPFCSARCADVDLGRWFTEAYRIPGEAADETEDEAPVRPPGRVEEGG